MMLSHPSWVRGLKQKLAISQFTLSVVAPLVGAWIETEVTAELSEILPVAPLVGAWIETASIEHNVRTALSHPSWVRGLKHVILLSREIII